MPKKVKDLTNNTYNRLTVLHFDKIARKKTYWWCKCVCGNEVSVQGGLLKCGQVKSCGCLVKETALVNSVKLVSEISQAKSRKAKGNIDSTMYVMLTDKISVINTSGVRGVTKMKNGKYKAYIVFKQKFYYLGCYGDIEDATKARKEAEKRIWGDFKEWYETLKKDKKEGLPCS